MKKIIMCSFFSLLFLSCKEKQEISFSENLLPELKFGLSAIKLPEGSLVRAVGGGYSFSLPKDYCIIGTDASGNSFVTGSSSIICDCTSGSASGCDPFYVGSSGLLGCINGDCEACEGTLEGASFSASQWIIADTSTEMGAFTEYQDFMDAPFFNSALLTLDGVEPIMRQFYNYVYPSGIPPFVYSNDPIPEGYDVIAVKLFGVAAFVVVPEGFDDDSPRMEILNNPAKIDCQCLDFETGSCQPQSHLGVKYCESNLCIKCKLTVRILVKNPDGLWESHYYNEYGYLIE